MEHQNRQDFRKKIRRVKDKIVVITFPPGESEMVSTWTLPYEQLRIAVKKQSMECC